MHFDLWQCTSSEHIDQHPLQLKPKKPHVKSEVAYSNLFWVSISTAVALSVNPPALQSTACMASPAQSVKYDQTWTFYSCHEGSLSAARLCLRKAILCPNLRVHVCTDASTHVNIQSPGKKAWRGIPHKDCCCFWKMHNMANTEHGLIHWMLWTTILRKVFLKENNKGQNKE